MATVKKAQNGITYTKDGDNYTATVTVKTPKGSRKYSASSPNMAFAKESATKKQFTNPADSVRTTKPVKQKNGGVTKAKDGKWIQKAVNPAHKGYCTPMTKPTCTPKRKALAKTFKAMAAKRKGK